MDASWKPELMKSCFQDAACTISCTKYKSDEGNQSACRWRPALWQFPITHDGAAETENRGTRDDEPDASGGSCLANSTLSAWTTKARLRRILYRGSRLLILGVSRK